MMSLTLWNMEVFTFILSINLLVLKACQSDYKLRQIFIGFQLWVLFMVQKIQYLFFKKDETVNFFKHYCLSKHKTVTDNTKETIHNL